MEELITNGVPSEQSGGMLPKVAEPLVSFKALSERGIYEVRSEAVEQPIFEISGYDLRINFNMQYLNSVEDIENCLEGVKELFRGIILDQLMENKKKLEKS